MWTAWPGGHWRITATRREHHREIERERMPTPTRLRTAAVIVSGGLLMALAAIYATSARPNTALVAPVVHEPFTPLPCSGNPKERSTVEEEGCIERQILATDA